MSTCEAEHKDCLEHFKSTSAQDLPTRLLKIEKQNYGLIRVRLVDTGDFQSVYACLSYCWGSSAQSTKTTTENRDEYRQAIPWQDLPPTIGDAIKLCCRLGFEYLWVDSLCIIQDDNQDWLREASQMAGIYRRSALTIAVHLCEDASESFLQQRLLDTEQWSDGNSGSAKIPFKDRSTGDRRVIYLWKDRDFKGSGFLDWGFQSIKAAREDKLAVGWFSRAWTFQEWILSPRVLHIHSTTVWDCLGSQGNELDNRFLSRSRLPRNFPDIDDWTEIVRDFSSRRITKEMDRLPALAGLAEWFQARTGHVYLAGLWLEELPRRLLWARAPQEKYMRKLPAYRAPTWSWAALEGRVQYNYLGEASITSNIIGHHCQYDPPETFATVTDGWLDIEGPMAVVNTCSLIRDHNADAGGDVYDDEDEEYDEYDATAYARLPTSYRRTLMYLYSANPEDGLTQQRWLAYLDLAQSLKEEVRRSEIYVLEILVVRGLRHALVLQKVQRHETEHDCYQRLGCACTEYVLAHAIPSTSSWARQTIRLI